MLKTILLILCNQVRRATAEEITFATEVSAENVVVDAAETAAETVAGNVDDNVNADDDAVVDAAVATVDR